MNNFDKFDRDFDRMSRRTRNIAMFAGFGAIIWMLFLMGAIGTGIWLVGRALSVW